MVVVSRVIPVVLSVLTDVVDNVGTDEALVSVTCVVVGTGTVVVLSLVTAVVMSLMVVETVLVSSQFMSVSMLKLP